MPICPFIPLLFLASYVSAHGFVFQVSINGQLSDTSPVPGAFDRSSAIRGISSQNPNYGVDNPALNCGPGARPADKDLLVQAGDTLKFDWRTASRTAWGHSQGPIITYIADCGTLLCSKFDSQNAKWFKIHQIGVGEDGNWVQKRIKENGAQAEVPIPRNLAPGNYLVRHEIIALHRARSPPTNTDGAEFYPSCIQLIVEGSGSGKPQESEYTTFPGGYGARDRGIYFPNGGNTANNYVFPGPSIAVLSNGEMTTSRNGTDVPASETKVSSTSEPEAIGGSETRLDSESIPTAEPSSTQVLTDPPPAGSETSVCRNVRRDTGHTARSSVIPRYMENFPVARSGPRPSFDLKKWVRL